MESLLNSMKAELYLAGKKLGDVLDIKTEGGVEVVYTDGRGHYTLRMRHATMRVTSDVLQLVVQPEYLLVRKA